MSVRYWLHGIQINIVPDNEFVKDIELNRINLDEYEPEINRGRRLLQRAKDSQPDAEIVSLSDPEAGIKVVSRFGKDEIQIKSKIKEKVVGKKGRTETIESHKYVLLVEMGSGPGAVAIFAPDGDGYGPGVGGGANLKFVGWTNDNHRNPPLISFEDLAANVTAYWLSGNIASANWIYAAVHSHDDTAAPIGGTGEIPTGFSFFKKGFFPPPPRSWASRVHNVCSYNIHESGGHYPALTQHKELASDILEFSGGLTEQKKGSPTS